MEDNPDYANFLRRLGQMGTNEILMALAEAKTGNKYFQVHLSLDVDAMAHGALEAYISALGAYNANRLINDSLK